MINFYKLLGINENASSSDILKAFKEKAKEFHPDKNNNSESSKKMFQYINTAKEWLTDPQKRLEYDQSIGVVPVQSSNGLTIEQGIGLVALGFALAKIFEK